ncbi:MAG: hypothetical protein QM757_24690 [Paludibaculum sp.]
MTPEELEQIAGIDATVVETIGASVNAFYNHLDAPAGEPQVGEQSEEVVEPAVENAPESELANAPADVEQPVTDESDTMGNSGLPVEQ